MKCHAIAGAGGQVGPATLQRRRRANRLPHQLGHHAEQASQGGRLFSTPFWWFRRSGFAAGIKVAEFADELVLKAADDKEITIPIKDIDDRKIGGSLMPDGLTDVLTRNGCWTWCAPVGARPGRAYW